MFIVLSVISKDVVELWEAVITFLMFPLVVIIAFLVKRSKRMTDEYSCEIILGGKKILCIEST